MSYSVKDWTEHSLSIEWKMKGNKAQVATTQAEVHDLPGLCRGRGVWRAAVHPRSPLEEVSCLGCCCSMGGLSRPPPLPSKAHPDSAFC